MDKEKAISDLNRLLDGGVSGEIHPVAVMVNRSELECKIYDYFSKSEDIYNSYMRGNITKEVALNRLDTIEREAYDKIPRAEPDGDITYCCASYTVKVMEGK